MIETNLTENNKYKNWVFTWNADENGFLPPEELLQTFMREKFDLYVFQLESGEETGRSHYQGSFKTKIRKRQGTLLKEFQSEFQNSVRFLTINRMCGTWDENYSYCTKDETRIGEVYMSSSLQEYKGNDISLFDSQTNWYPWQKEIDNILFAESTLNIKAAHDRDILWITDEKGNCGKSKYTKFLCFNNSDIVKIPIGTAAQLRSAAVAAGPRKVYIIDIPRTLGGDDSIADIITVIEDLKNGFITSAFYGKYGVMMFDIPHIVVFSNMKCPFKSMSADRWVAKIIDYETKELVEQHRIPQAVVRDPIAYYQGEEDYDIF